MTITSRFGESSVRRAMVAVVTVIGLSAAGGAVLAADVLRPASVQGLRADTLGADLQLDWDAVITDIGGHPETVASYRVFRGSTPDWPGDYTEIGSSSGPSFLVTGGASGAAADHYLIVAVDADGNEGQPRPGSITAAPTLGGAWTRFTIELSWTAAEPAAEVASYRVYFGTQPGAYDTVIDAGSALSLSLADPTILVNTQYFITVAAVDHDGFESVFSNEHAEAMGGTVIVRAQDESRVCFGAAGCPPQPGEIQHDSGREIVTPIRFPVGDDWTRVRLIYTVDSRLCDVANMCGGPPWNPCGDPWDRTTSVVLVMNDCATSGARCYGNSENLELIRAVTPFGTDADPPDGNGDVGPRTWALDITPYQPLLSGEAHIAAFVGVWVSAGWYVTVDFEFTEITQLTSPKPPADGIALVSFKDGGNVSGPTSVTIPAGATQVMGRLFTTGHGGQTDPAICSCGGGAPCDEFCQKSVEIKVDDTMVWSTVPWRTDCSPTGNSCSNWNACGFPSCTYPRSGWCPGYVACHHNAPCDQDIDLTPWLTPGGTYDVMVDVPEITVPGGIWANSLAVYWYE